MSIRFANPSFDCMAKTYCLDVEYMSDNVADTLYGTNVRFFYNSTELTFKELRNFAPDYGIALSFAAQTGISSSGASLFNFDSGEAATWVNGGIELQNINSGTELGSGTWTKFYEVCFDIPGNPSNVNDFCPEVIWDLETDRNDGGFFPGNDGVVITIKDGSGSKVSDEVVEHLNWDYSGTGAAPYGDYAQSVGGCVTESCVVCNVPSTAPPLKSP
ncbi:MAG: hypothetical protein V3V00_09010 [Saprospiraceae bacterium]